jgi:hypothetical protein
MDVWSNKHEKGYNSCKNQPTVKSRSHLLCTELVICLLSHFIHIWYLGWSWSEHTHIIPISWMVGFCKSYSPFHVCLTICPFAHLVYATCYFSFVAFYLYTKLYCYKYTFGGFLAIFLRWWTPLKSTWYHSLLKAWDLVWLTYKSATRFEKYIDHGQILIRVTSIIGSPSLCYGREMKAKIIAQFLY